MAEIREKEEDNEMKDKSSYSIYFKCDMHNYSVYLCKYYYL